MVTRTETLIPEHHSKEVVFRDHFGHTHHVLMPTHVAVEDPALPFPRGPVEIKEYQAELDNIEKMMCDREIAFLHHCLKSPQHSTHPLVLSHPDNPRNKPAKE